MFFVAVTYVRYVIASYAAESLRMKNSAQMLKKRTRKSMIRVLFASLRRLDHLCLVGLHLKHLIAVVILASLLCRLRTGEGKKERLKKTTFLPSASSRIHCLRANRAS